MRTTSPQTKSPSKGAGPHLYSLDAPLRVRLRTDALGRPTEVLRAPRESRRVRGSERIGKVMAIRETWRIDDEWWRRPISRLYYEVVLENGRILTLYLDLIEGEWWKQ